MQDYIILGIIIFAVLTVILGILLPFFVVGIFLRLGTTEVQLRETYAMLATLASDQSRTVILMRQQLRAYGHEPEA
jgi:hypothetical protein